MILFIINFSNFDDLSGWVDMVFSKKEMKYEYEVVKL